MSIILSFLSFLLYSYFPSFFLFFSFFFLFPYSFFFPHIFSIFLKVHLIHSLHASVSTNLARQISSRSFLFSTPVPSGILPLTRAAPASGQLPLPPHARCWPQSRLPLARQSPQADPRRIRRRQGPIMPIGPGLLLRGRTQRASVRIKEEEELQGAIFSACSPSSDWRGPRLLRVAP